MIDVPRRNSRLSGLISQRLRRWQVFLLLGLLWITSQFLTSPALADPLDLSLTVLQQRIEQPVRKDGQVVIDLQGTHIDLRDAQADFREQFYQRLHNGLQSETGAIGLDLSDAVILGDLDLAKLGQRLPQYADTLALNLSPEAQQQFTQDFEQIERSRQGTPAPLAPEQTIFRGSLNLVNTTLTGTFTATNTYFLNQVDAGGSIFTQGADWSGARFIRSVSFSGAQFHQSGRFRNSIFLKNAQFNQTHFSADTTFQSSDFQESADFSQAKFSQAVNFNHSHWQGDTDFSQSLFQQSVSFAKANFKAPLSLEEARFEAPVIFRQTQFHHPVNLRSTILYNQVDFGDAQFLDQTTLNVTDLEFDSKDAQILGTPGQIGQVFAVPTLTGNETVLRNLVRNFRRLEQIGDANQLEYATAQLRLRQWKQILLERAPQQPGLSSLSIVSHLLILIQGLGLSLLLLLSHYGTSFGLVFGVGLVAISTFGLLYWGLDHWLSPSESGLLLYETTCMLASATVLTALGVGLIFRSGDSPGLTLACLSLLIGPLPITLSFNLMGQTSTQGQPTPDKLLPDKPLPSYFVQDGGARQVRFLITRLPVIPEFPFYRDRYSPLSRVRRWNWLNYFDFSLNNWLRFGFNDTRLRDQAIPGQLATLVWYQWSLGVLYIALLLWTLSRTIPGLNLLLYF